MMERTIFRFPGPISWVKIMRAIHSGHPQRAYKLLARFYKVPEPKSSIDPNAIYDVYKETFKNIHAIYFHDGYKIAFKSPNNANNETTVLHEFFHHLGNVQSVKHDNETPDSWAEHFRLAHPGLEYLSYAPNSWNEGMIVGKFEAMVLLHVAGSQGVTKEQIPIILGHEKNWYFGWVAKYDRSTRRYVKKGEWEYEFWKYAPKFYPQLDDVYSRIWKNFQRSVEPKNEIPA